MRKKVLLFIPQGSEELELSAFTDVFGWNKERNLHHIDLITCGFHNIIRCAWNLRIVPELLFDEIQTNDFDALAIPGGFETAGYYLDAFDRRLLQLIRDFHHKNLPIASICVGALALGKSGILKAKKATTYDLPPIDRKTQLSIFGAIVQDQSLVTDKGIITSTGPSTALDVAFTLLEMLSDVDNVNEVKKMMRFVQ
jgi:protein deglycase